MSRDGLEHHIKMLKDLYVSETQKVDAKRLNGNLSGLISSRRSLLEVTITVDFNRESCSGTIEIDHISRNAVLPSKLVAKHLTSSELRP
jgi:hypothetical protein